MKHITEKYLKEYNPITEILSWKSFWWVVLVFVIWIIIGLNV